MIEKMSEVELQTDADGIDAAFMERCRDDFLFFADSLVIPAARGPSHFDACMAEFQREFFEDAVPSLHAVRDGTLPPLRRFWLERTKKAAKDSDVAICLLWLMAFPKRPVLVQVCASNQKQAGIIKRRIRDILHYNPWLNGLVRILQNKIVNADRVGEVIIEATDTAGATHGETPDLLVLNELVHVAKWSVMETHMNNADGTPRGVVVVATNSGFKGTKAEAWRKTALENRERWSVHVWSEKAPWLDDEDVAEAKKRNPPAEYQRLFRGKWVSGIGDAVEEGVIDACFRSELSQLDRPEPGWVYGAGLDLGVSHDHAGLTAIGVDVAEQRIRVARITSWEPTMETAEGNMEVDLMAVERECRRVAKVFRLDWLYYDPAAGGSFMAQRLAKAGVPMRKMSFSSPANLTAMAQGFVQVLNDGVLECFEDERMRRDFGKFDIKRRLPTGYRLVAVSDEHGHADVGTALVVTLPAAVELLATGGYGLDDEDELVSCLEEDGTREEVDGLPDELRAIYDSSADEDWDGV
jgi:hypothetical protein